MKLFGHSKKKEKCELIEAYKKMIDYQQKIIDRLLVKLGSAPIKEKLTEKEEPDEVAEILSKGGMVLGE